MKTYGLIAFAALMLAACNIKEEPCVIGGNEGNETTLVTVVLPDGIKFSPGSRASDEGEDNERKISWLEFFVFASDGTQDEVTPYRKIEEFAEKTMLRIANNNGIVTFVVVANYGTEGSAGIGEMATYNDLLAELASREMTANLTPLNHNATVVPAHGFEMSGKNTAIIKKGSHTNTVVIELDRVVSKFSEPEFATSDLVNLPEECMNELWGEVVDNSNITFEFEGYAFINGLNKTLLMNRDDWGPWDEKWFDWLTTTGMSAGLKYIGAEFDDDDDFENTYSGKDEDDSWFIDGPVYAYENVPAQITLHAAGYDRDKVYAMIIKGSLTANENSMTRYWRINLIKDSKYIILRNKHYKITVTSINSCGFRTPQEAVEDLPIVPIDGDTYVNVIVTINPWDVIESSTEM